MSWGYIGASHTAVGLYAAEKLKADYPESDVVVLSTAHPIKFADIVERGIGNPLSKPSFVAELMAKPRKSESLENDFEKFKCLMKGIPG